LKNTDNSIYLRYFKHHQDLKETDLIYITMPSMTKKEYNKKYYAENCDDILYKRRSEWKPSPTIKCPCGERAQYKDNTSSRNAHFKTGGHRIWLKKKRIVDLMTGNILKHSQAYAEQFIEDRLAKVKAKSAHAVHKEIILLNLNIIVMECISAIDNNGKPKPKPKAAAEPEPEPEPEPFDPEVPHVPPSADFDPLSLAIETPKPPSQPSSPKAYLSKPPLPDDFDLSKLL